MKMKILAVDDEKEMIELLQITLRPIYSTFDHTDSLEEALRMVQDKKYNVVTLDLRLLDAGKEESLRAIRSFKEHNVAVVVISGIIDPHIKDEVMSAGADAYIQKDGSFNSHAIMVALNIATLKLPKESYRSDSFLDHVKLLDRIVHTAA